MCEEAAAQRRRLGGGIMAEQGCEEACCWRAEREECGERGEGRWMVRHGGGERGERSQSRCWVTVLGRRSSA
eukprot:2888947-Rhodomonas_salina.4